MKSTLEIVQRKRTFPAAYQHRAYPNLIVLFNTERTGTVLYDTRFGLSLPIGHYDGWVDKATDSLHWERLPSGTKVLLENTEDTGFPALYIMDIGAVVLFTAPTKGTVIVSTPGFPPPGNPLTNWYSCEDDLEVWERLPIGEQVVYVQPKEPI